MRASLIGLGSIGRRHLANLLSLGVEVHAMDVSDEARRFVRGAFSCASVSESVRFDVDALIICTPYDHHLAWVEEAVRRRIPFFVEKPLGSLEQLPRWRELAAMELPVNQVGYHLRFHPDVKWLRDMEPEWVDLSVSWDSQKYADVLLESSHEIDLARYLIGEDLIVRDVNVKQGGWLVIQCDRACVGIKGDGEYERVWEAESGHRMAHVEYADPQELGESAYRDELIHFLYCVRNGIATDVPVAEGLATLEVCQQVEQMAKQAV